MQKTHHIWLVALLLSSFSPLLAAQACPGIAGVKSFSSTGWGLNEANQRFQSDAKHQLHRHNVGSLELAWA